jgi:uncharacterized membrane protein
LTPEGADSLNTTRHHRALHRLFLVSVWIKAIAGVLETLAGLALPLLSEKTLVSLVVLFTAPELTEDPNDPVANYLRSSAQNFSASTQSFASAYLVIHGLIKVVLVAGLLWGRHMWAYAAAMWALVAFIVYQMYLYARAPSPWLILLTVVDLVVIYLVWREYQWRKQVMIDGDSPKKPS